MPMNNPLGQRSFGSRSIQATYQPYDSSMHEIISRFKSSYKEATNLKACLTYEGKSIKQTEEVSDYLSRSRIIMAYSAFDLFMHEIVYHGYEMMQRGKLNKSNGYLRFKKEQEDNKRLFKEQYKETFGRVTLTSSNLKDALRDLGFNPMEVANLYCEKQGLSCRGNLALEKVNTELNTKASRRNAIVHAYDYDIYNGQQNEIDEKTSDEFVTFISGVVNTICEFVDTQWNRSMNTMSHEELIKGSNELKKNRIARPTLCE